MRSLAFLVARDLVDMNHFPQTLGADIHPPNQEKIKMMVSKGAWALGRVRAMELEAEVSKRRQVKIRDQIRSNQIKPNQALTGLVVDAG